MVECHVASTWLLAGGSLRELAKVTVARGRAICDPGCDGNAVCGLPWMEKFLAKLVALGKRDEITRETPSGMVYRFGGGSAVAIATWNVPVKVRGRWEKLEVDVVPGWLPLLMGLEAGGQFRLVLDLEDRAIHTKTSKGLKLLSQGRAGDTVKLLTVPLLPDDPATPLGWAKTLCTSADHNTGAEVASEADTDTSAESDRESVASEPQDHESEEDPPQDRGARATSAVVGNTGGKTFDRINTMLKEELASAPKSDAGTGSARRRGAPRTKQRLIAEKERLARKLKKEISKDKVKPLVFPRVFESSDHDLRKMHLRGHAPTRRMREVVIAAMPRSFREDARAAKHISSLLKRVDEVCRSCRRCMDHQHSLPPSVAFPTVLQPNERVMNDLLVLKVGTKTVYVLVTVDVATLYTKLRRCKSKHSEEVSLRFYLSWVCVLGPPGAAEVSDNGGEFIGNEWRSHAMSKGYFKGTGGAVVPQSHGYAENRIRAVRWSADRTVGRKDGPRTDNEIDFMLGTIENSTNNEFLVDQQSASQRMTGRNSSADRNLLNDTLTTPNEYGSILTLQRVAEMALEDFRAVVFDRRLRQLVASKVRPDVRVYTVGELVVYKRPRADGKGSEWRGPGIVSGWNPVGKYYTVEHGGVQVRPGRFDMRGVDEPKVGAVPPAPRLAPPEDWARDPLREEEVERDDLPEVPEEPEKGEPEVPVLQEDEARVAEEPRLSESELRPEGAPRRVSWGNPEEVRDLPRRDPSVERELEVGAESEEEEYPSGSESEGLPVVRRSRRLSEQAARQDAAERARFEASRGHAAAIEREYESENWARVAPSLARGVKGGGRLEDTESVDGAEIDQETGHQRDRGAVKEPGGNLAGDPLPGEAVDVVWPDGQVYTGRWAPTKRRTEIRYNDGGIDVVRQAGADGLYKDADGDTRVVYRRALLGLGESHCERSGSVLVEDLGLQNRASEVIALNALAAGEIYAFTWDDVPEAAKQDAINRAIEDYNKYKAWDDSMTYTVDELYEKFGNAITLFDGTWVRKAKIVKGELRGRGRWTPRGFRELDPGNVTAPTAAWMSIRAMETERLRRKWKTIEIDFESAFFQVDIYEGSDLFLETPPEMHKGSARRWRRLTKLVPGTKGGPRSWYKTLSRKLKLLNFVQSRIDPCIWFHFDEQGELECILPIHVDDTRGGASDECIAWMMVAMHGQFVIGMAESGQQKTTFVGVTFEDQFDDNGVLVACDLHQFDYIDNKCIPIEISAVRTKARNDEATPNEFKQFQTLLGCMMWILRTVVEVCFELSVLASRVADLRIDDLLRLNRLVRAIRNPHNRHPWRIPSIDCEVWKVLGIGDSSLGNVGDEETRTQGCRVLGMVPYHPGKRGEATDFSCVDVRSGRVRRVVHSSFDGETVVAVEIVDTMLSLQMLLDELRRGPYLNLLQRKILVIEGQEPEPEILTRGELHTDCNSLVTRTNSLKVDPNMTKRRKLDVADIKEVIQEGFVDPLVHINGDFNPANAGTKKISWYHVTMRRLVALVTDCYYEPMYGSTKQRSKGKK